MASEALYRLSTIGTVGSAIARADGEVRNKGLDTMVLGQAPDAIVQLISPDRGREQPQGKGEGWLQAHKVKKARRST